MAMELFDLEQDVMAGLEDDMKASAKADARIKMKKGIIPTFKMPKNADPQTGKREATVRFLTPIEGAVRVIEHHRFSNPALQIVCPVTFGLECQWCEMLMERSGVSRKELYADADSMRQYANPWEKGDIAEKRDFKTEYVYIWNAWHKELELYGSDEAGGQVMFAWYYNSTTPLPRIHDLNYKMFKKPIEDNEPATLDQYDVYLTQTGESKKRSFDAHAGKVRPFQHADRVKNVSKVDMVFHYALGIYTTDEAWLERLHEIWKKTKAAPVAKPVAKKPATKVEANDDVEFGDD